MKRIFISLFLACPFISNSQELKKNEFSLSLGYMFAGEVYIAEANRYGSVGETILIKAEFDHYFGDHFGVGAYYTLAFPYYDGFEAVTVHEVGAVLKARFNAGEKLQIKPGAYVGYRSYSNSAGTGLGVNGSVAFQFQASEKIKPFIELGILSQPVGGNDATDITYSPTFQASVGLTF